jgi:hypothetical protein
MILLIVATISGVFSQKSYATIQDNEQIIYNFLRNEMNLNQAAACGVLANIRTESNFNPIQIGDKGTSYGICQWHDSKYGNRKQNLINWCKKNAYDYKTLTGQLNYLKYELSANNYSILYNGKTIYNYLLSVSNDANGAYNAGYYWCYNYELPTNKTASSIERGNLAKDTYWSKYNEVEVDIKEKVLEAPVVKLTNTSKGVQISWTETQGAKQYRIYRKNEGDTKWTIYKNISGQSTVSYIDTKVTNGANYQYTVRAISGTQKSVYQLKYVKSICYINRPSITSISGKKNYIQLQWAKNSKASGYEICYAKNSSFTSTKKVTITSKSTLTKKITSLSKTKYYVKIRTYKTVNKVKYYSEWSAVKKLTL